jgi:hypothetical protein
MEEVGKKIKVTAGAAFFAFVTASPVDSDDLILNP